MESVEKGGIPLKKILALVLVMLVLCICGAQAESTTSVFDALEHLINGRTFTLTVTAQSDTDELADIISRYGI